MHNWTGGTTTPSRIAGTITISTGTHGTGTGDTVRVLVKFGEVMDMLVVSTTETIVDLANFADFKWESPAAKTVQDWPVVKTIPQFRPHSKQLNYQPFKRANRMSYQQRRQNKRRMFCQKLRSRNDTLSRATKGSL